MRSADDVAALRVPDPHESTPYVLEAIRLLRRELPAAVAADWIRRRAVHDGDVPRRGPRHEAVRRDQTAAVRRSRHRARAHGDVRRDRRPISRGTGAKPAPRRRCCSIPGHRCSHHARLPRVCVALRQARIRRRHTCGLARGARRSTHLLRRQCRGLARCLSGARTRPLSGWTGAWTWIVPARRWGAARRAGESRSAGAPRIHRRASNRTPRDVIRRAGPTGHIFNLGHGILPETPPDHARYLVDSRRASSRRRGRHEAA